MICANCGNQIEDGASICPGCGAPVAAAEGLFNGNPSVSGYQEPGLKRMDFYKHPNVSAVRKQLRGCGIAMYIVAVINCILFAILGDIIVAVISLLLYIGLGLGIHLGQSRVCAIVLTAYGVFNTIVTSMQTGSLSGWIFPLIGVYGIIYTFKFHKAWKQYKDTGIIPFIAGR